MAASKLAGFDRSLTAHTSHSICCTRCTSASKHVNSRDVTCKVPSFACGLAIARLGLSAKSAFPELLSVWPASCGALRGREARPERKMKTSKNTGLWRATIVASLLLGCSKPSEQASKNADPALRKIEPGKISMAYQPIVFGMPVFVAQGQKFFEKNNLVVDAKSFTSANDMINAVVADADMCRSLLLPEIVAYDQLVAKDAGHGPPNLAA